MAHGCVVLKAIKREAGCTVPIQSDGSLRQTAQPWQSRHRLRLMAAEELVDRSSRRDIQVHREMGLERRAVRANAMQGVGEGRRHDLAILFKGAIGQGERAGVGGQAGVGQRHGDKVPVQAILAWMRPSANVVRCVTRLVVRVMV